MENMEKILRKSTDTKTKKREVDYPFYKELENKVIRMAEARIAKTNDPNSTSIVTIPMENVVEELYKKPEDGGKVLNLFLNADNKLTNDDIFNLFFYRENDCVNNFTKKLNWNEKAKIKLETAVKRLEEEKKMIATKRDGKVGTLEDLNKDHLLYIIKKRGFIEEPPKPEVIKTEFKNLAGIKEIELSEEEKESMKAKIEDLENKELSKSNITDRTVNSLINKFIPKKESWEISAQYYRSFKHKTGIKEEDIEKDIKRLKEIKDEIAKRYPEYTKNKKIADLTEYALFHYISKMNWYGENVQLSQTKEFDDICRGVDAVLEINKSEGEGENTLAGLGIDATYRDINDKYFETKIFGILNNIANNKITKIKYHEDSKGRPLPESPIPKIIISFDIHETDKLIGSLEGIKNQDDYSKIENTKISTLKQIFAQCKIFGDFCEKQNTKNSLLLEEKYRSVNKAMEIVNKNNPNMEKIIQEVKNDIGVDSTNPVIKRIYQLVSEFKKN